MGVLLVFASRIMPSLTDFEWYTQEGVGYDERFFLCSGGGAGGDLGCGGFARSACVVGGIYASIMVRLMGFGAAKWLWMQAFG